MKRSAPHFLEVTTAKYVSDYKLLLTFSDGVVRLVDFGPFLEAALNPDTADYRDLKKFKRFHLQDGDLMWGDYQMIFPVMDLYHGTILKGEQAPADYFALSDADSQNKPLKIKQTLKGGASYKPKLKNRNSGMSRSFPT